MREAPAALSMPPTRSRPAPTADTIDRTVWITPEISADVLVHQDTQSAEVTLVSGTQVMLTIALSQGANSAVAEHGAAVGSARIKPGLRLDYKIATPLQDGALYLDGNFASSNLPRVHFQGVLATWSQPPRLLSSATKE